MAVIAGEAVTVHRLARDEARRIAVGAQLLDADRPSALVPMVERLTFLQVDPNAAIAPSADLVAWSRMGASYEPEDLRRALEEQRDGPADERPGPLPRRHGVTTRQNGHGTYHDRLVGKLDATADRKAGVLRVHAIHQDARFTRTMTADIDAEIEFLAAWLGLAVKR